MKYPLDRQGVENIVHDLLQTDASNRYLISELHHFLKLAIEYGSGDTADWYPDAKSLMLDISTRKMTFDSFRFDQNNGHKLDQTSPYDDFDSYQPNLVQDGEFSEEELAKHFGERVQPKKKEVEVDKMTLQEIEEWEKKQDNSLDIYKVVARVKNLAREGGGNLTSTGEMLINCYTHVLMALYGFAEKLDDKDVKIKLTELIRANENMPANFMAAVNAGVKLEKS